MVAVLVVLGGCTQTPIETQPVASSSQTTEIEKTLDSAERDLANTTESLPNPTESLQKTNGSVRNPFRPPAVTTEVVTQTIPQAAGSQLIGIARKQNELVALFNTNGQIEQLRKGESLNGWYIHQINATRVVLQNGIEQKTVMLP